MQAGQTWNSRWKANQNIQFGVSDKLQSMLKSDVQRRVEPVSPGSEECTEQGRTAHCCEISISIVMGEEN